MGSGLKWSVEEEHLLRLLLPTNSFDEIEIEFNKRLNANLIGFRCERSADAIRRKCERDNLYESQTYTSSLNPTADRWRAIAKLQKQYESESVPSSRGLIPVDKIARKILSLSDIHFPIARKDKLKEVIDLHADADIVVVNGDLLDGYAFSSFEKDNRIAMLHEYQVAFSFIKILQEKFPNVVLVSGNHDARVAKSLKRAGYETEAVEILRPDLIGRIANGEELDSTGMLIKKHDFSNVHYQSRENWYVRIGKTIFAHPHNRGSGQPGFTVNKLHKDYFSRRYTSEDYDSVVSGHTHKIYRGIVNNTLLIEQGCFAGLLDYAFKPDLRFTPDSMNGYAVIYQDEKGNTCFNQSTPFFLGEVMPPKKPIIDFGEE